MTTDAIAGRPSLYPLGRFQMASRIQRRLVRIAPPTMLASSFALVHERATRAEHSPPKLELISHDRSPHA
jgi:hypothetical protein